MWIYFLLLPALILAQTDEEAVGGAENIRQLYGIATKIMELSGNFMGGGGNGGSGYEEVRPRFQGVRSFSEDNSILSGGSSSGGLNNMAKMIKNYQGMFANANFIQPTTTTTERPTGFKSIIDSFLGTGGNRGGDDDMENLPPPPTPKPRPRQNLFSLLGGPTNSEAAPAPKPDMGTNIFQNFFGIMPTTTTTTTTTTEATPVQKLMNIFVPQSENRENQESSGRGRINLLELFGMAPRTTTTTTQAPLQALFAPNRPYSGTAQDFDGIVNALLRSNARPARQEPASILSQFFGGKK